MVENPVIEDANYMPGSLTNKPQIISHSNVPGSLTTSPDIISHSNIPGSLTDNPDITDYSHFPGDLVDSPMMLGAGSDIEKPILSGASGTIVETDPLSVHLNQTVPQTMIGLSDGYLKLTSGVIGTGSFDLSSFTTDDLTQGMVNLYDQIITLTEGANITITGAYPNFTIASSGGGSGGDHSLLSNLNWSVAGHTFDSDISLGAYKQVFSEISTPGTPSADNVYLYAKDKAGVSTLYYKKDNGSEIEIGSGGGGGDVTSVFSRTGDVVSDYDDYTWAQIDKSVSDLIDIATRNHSDLSGVGTNTHDSIDAHIADVSTNPHNVTALQTGAVDCLTDQTIFGVKTFNTLPQSNDYPDEDTDFANKSYVDTITAGLNWTYSPCLQKGVNDPPASPTSGDRYIVGTSPSGVWVGHENDIATWNGTSWVFVVEVEGFALLDLSTGNQWRYIASIGAWRQIGMTRTYLAGNGLTLSSNVFKLGGSLTANTTISQASYDLTFNLSGTGDFIVQDVGTTRFCIDDGGRAGFGTTPYSVSQVYIKPSLDTYRGLTFRPFSVTQTANLLEFQDATGTLNSSFGPNGQFAYSRTLDTTSEKGVVATQVGLALLSNSSSGVNETFDQTYEAFKITTTLADNYRLLQVQLKIDVAAGNPSAGITAYVYSDNAGVPGTLLVTGSTIHYGELTAAYASYYFGITYAATAGVTYWVVLKQTAAPTGSVVSINGASVGTDNWAYSANGTSWSTKGFTPYFVLRGRTYYAVNGNSDTSFAVYGSSKTSYGGYFASLSGMGVYGTSTNGTGVYGVSTYNYGGRFDSTYGTALGCTTTTGYGIYATSTSGTGIRAITTSGSGIVAVSTSGTAITASTTLGVGMIVGVNPATTTTSHELLRLLRNTSGTAAAGLGGYISWQLEDAGGTLRQSGLIDNVWEDATSRHSFLDFQNARTNVVASRMRLFSTGNLSIGNTTDSGYKLDVTGTTRTSGLNINSAYSLPTADGISSYVLTTNGAGTVTWSAVPATTHNVLSATHSDSTTGNVVRGDIITGQGASPTWTKLAKGSAGKFLTTDANDTVWSTATLPSTATGTGKVLRADGTNWAASTFTIPDTFAISSIPYATSANVLGVSASFKFDGTNLTLPSAGDIRPSANATNAINIAQADGTDFVTFDTTNKWVLIGSGVSAVAGLTVYNNNGIVWRADGTTAQMAVKNTHTSTGNAVYGAVSMASGGDPMNWWAIKDDTDTTYLSQWSLGIDNSDSDKLNFSYVAGSTATPSNGRLVTIHTTGEVSIGTTDLGGLLYLNKAQNALTDAWIINTTNDTTAGARLYVANGTAANGIMTFAFPTNHTTLSEFAGDSGLYTTTYTRDLVLASRSTAGVTKFYVGGNTSANRIATLTTAGLGMGVTVPTAVMHLKAGTATASTAPFKFTSGTNLTVPEAGAMEYDGTNLYFTPASTRKTVLFVGDTGSMVYPGAGVAVSTGTAWTTSLNATALGSIAGLTYASTAFVKMTGTNTFSLDTNTYLTAESDTLNSVTTRGATTANDVSVGDVKQTRSGTINRSGGYITSVAKTGGRTITCTRDGNGYISSLADGSNTWTLTRDGNHYIQSWSVA